MVALGFWSKKLRNVLKRMININFLFFATFSFSDMVVQNSYNSVKKKRIVFVPEDAQSSETDL